MKSLSSFFELPWLITILFSYLAATYNNTHQKHLEVFSPLVLCGMAAVCSFLMFRQYEMRLTSLFPYLRFTVAGTISIFIIYYIWLEFGSAYLKEGGLGIFVFYMFFGGLSFLILFGLAFLEGFQSGLSISKGEIFVYAKVAFSIAVMLVFIYGLYLYMSNSKIGAGKALSIANSWNDKNNYYSKIKFTAEESSDEIQISVDTDALIFWSLKTQETNKLLESEDLKASLEEQMNRWLADDVFLKILPLPYKGWRAEITSNGDVHSMTLSIRVNIANKTRVEWSASIQQIKSVAENNNAILLNWIAYAQLKKHQFPNEPNSFSSACREIAFSILRDENSVLLQSINQALEAGDIEFFNEKKIEELSMSQFTSGEYKFLKPKALRLLRFSLLFGN